MCEGLACAARLAPVKTIGAAFRVSGKALPTAPSFFVAEILGPLRDFLGAHTSELELSGEAPAAGWRAAEWAAAVGDHVCDAYKTLAEASLDTVRKNEEALRRLHAKRDGSGAKEGEVADGLNTPGSARSWRMSDGARQVTSVASPRTHAVTPHAALEVFSRIRQVWRCIAA